MRKRESQGIFSEGSGEALGIVQEALRLESLGKLKVPECS